MSAESSSSTSLHPSLVPTSVQNKKRLLEEGKHPVLYQWVDYDQISPYLIRAVVAAEDADFMHHNGLRWDAIKTAAERNLLSDKRAPGGSTLTQQTVKDSVPRQKLLQKSPGNHPDADR